jgi:hypothetical protein
MRRCYVIRRCQHNPKDRARMRRPYYYGDRLRSFANNSVS